MLFYSLSNSRPRTFPSENTLEEQGVSHSVGQMVLYQTFFDFGFEFDFSPVIPDKFHKSIADFLG
jgi:hypothetical protein